MGICEFCNEKADTEATSMTGAYCIDCLRITRGECLDAIKKLQKRASKNTKKKTTKEQYDNALNNPMAGTDGAMK